MKNKKIGILVGSSIVFILACTIGYWFLYSKPASFPDDDQLIEKINKFYPEAEAQTIQDKVIVDDRHAVVPFISSQNNYSLSIWVWELQEWKVASIETKGDLRVWKINEKNPASYQFVWNLHPGDQLSSMNIYLIRERGYHKSDTVDRYYPRVQMVENFNLGGKSYGVMQMPEDWVGVMKASAKAESPNNNNLFIDDFLTRYSMYFGWTMQSQSEQFAFPERSVNGDGKSNGNIDLDYVMILNESEIEPSNIEE